MITYLLFLQSDTNSVHSTKPPSTSSPPQVVAANNKENEELRRRVDDLERRVKVLEQALANKSARGPTVPDNDNHTNKNSADSNDVDDDLKF